MEHKKEARSKRTRRQSEPPNKRTLRSRLWRLSGLRGKTGWDWLQLLIVPLALAGIGFVFTMQQDTRQQQIEDQRAQQALMIENERAEAERELAEQRAQDEALQAYLTQMGSLLLEKDLRNLDSDSEVRTLARARTLTVLGRLDSSRKAAVMHFFFEARLVQGEEERAPIISLAGANLREAVLGGGSYPRGADLEDADLEGAALSDATLADANLFKANLIHADLREADLSFATLADAHLFEANLSNADLSSAVLADVALMGADLSGAELDANLNGANLSGADLSNADLFSAVLAELQKLKRLQSGVTLGTFKMPHGSADLREANLIRADLSSADLSGADLGGAYMHDTTLGYADLNPALLSGADLSGADLRYADLGGANLAQADLSGTDLREAEGVTRDLLEQEAKSVEGATMPDGSKHP
jgi:uncharacterized protein YjbI with pentapeptide repeats